MLKTVVRRWRTVFTDVPFLLMKPTTCFARASSTPGEWMLEMSIASSWTYGTDMYCQLNDSIYVRATSYTCGLLSDQVGTGTPPDRPTVLATWLRLLSLALCIPNRSRSI